MRTMSSPISQCGLVSAWRGAGLCVKSPTVARQPPLDRLYDDLSAVRRDPASPVSADLLRAALAARANVVVAKAARLVREVGVAGFEAELAAAFLRLMKNPLSLDRGCEATTAIAQALLEQNAGSDEAVRAYLAGVRHVQVDGPGGDSAAALRGYCGMGLLAARHPNAVVELTDLLADPEPAARVGAARGLGSAGREEAALLLRLKLRLRDRSADVMAECMAGVLRLDPARSVGLVAEFLRDRDDELTDVAAMALGESRLAAALAPLKAAFDRQRDAGRRGNLLLAAAVLRRPEGVDWLISVLAHGIQQDAAAALTALATVYRADANVTARVRAAVETRDSPALTQAMEKAWRG